jgi:Na+-translocating ferredoxin:NAD+ oxidoreductase subunit D
LAERTWTVSVASHIRGTESTARIMWQVVAALSPAGAWGIYTFGWGAARVMLLSVVTAVLSELTIRLVRRKPVSIGDGSAVVTGLLLAFVLPSHTPANLLPATDGAATGLAPLPWFLPVVGAFVAIAIAKEAFGGLGSNIWNPALVGRAFVQVSFPRYMSLTYWPWPRGAESAADATTQATAAGGGAVDALTRATPLARFQDGVHYGAYSLKDLFLGNHPGCIGEIMGLLLVVGGIYLIARRYVDWRLPLVYILTVFVGVVLIKTFALKDSSASEVLRTGLYHVLAGGLLLGAFFMATDMVTTPMTHLGQAIFGFGCGVLTVTIRLYAGYPEGVCYAILLMNTTTPIIDRHTQPRVFGSGAGGNKH